MAFFVSSSLLGARSGWLSRVRLCCVSVWRGQGQQSWVHGPYLPHWWSPSPSLLCALALHQYGTRKWACAELLAGNPMYSVMSGTQSRIPM